MRDERGQILPLAVLAILTVGLGVAALVVDVGQAYWAKRQLQSATDAAALAAADALGTGTQQAFAVEYGPNGSNPVHGVSDASLTVATRCLNRTPDCALPNEVVVHSTAHVSTTFARLFGIGSFTVNTSAQACAPCGTQPLDIEIILDRTESMSGADVQGAIAGVKTFLSLLDPAVDYVGLTVLPPAPPGNEPTPACEGPADYNAKKAPYAIVPIGNDYQLATGRLNPQGSIVTELDCIHVGGKTDYADAIDAAGRALDDQQPIDAGLHRDNVQKVIVMMSDGAANDGPNWHGKDSPYLTQPCRQGIDSSHVLQQDGTLVYTIGYGVGGWDADKVCIVDLLNGHWITAEEALRGIASTPDDYLGVDADPSLLTNAFARIGYEVAHGSSLVSADA